MSSGPSPCACRTGPFCRDDQSWVEPHLGYPWWNVSQHSIQKLLLQQIAAPYVACIYSVGFFLFPPLLILNVILETVVPGLVLPGVCALGEYLPWVWEFPKCLMWYLDVKGWDVPSKPWEDDDGYLGKCLAFCSSCSPSSATPPPVWFLPDSPLSAFNPGTRSRFPLCACFTPPFPQQEVREAKPDRWEQSLVSELHLQFSPGRTGCSITCHPQIFLCFISTHLKPAGAFQRGVVMNILYIIKTGAKLFLRDPSSPSFFFFLVALVSFLYSQTLSRPVKI